ncbi:methyltransferase family protein [Hephaestia caeni]|uniref:Methyltransferase family protein n=1 Tax=Hephaestia caeni TaxID=645617 RepID=A0A397NIL6_9SPHN|nr:class I SAM-dependent methyltransferase [Hephaestia caeni]RIA35353.1 methyltransferase family protein [Hephaestia caeni]
MEHIQCPNCASDRTVEWAREGGFIAVKCTPCGLIYVNPRPSAAEITEANKVGVHRTQNGKALNVSARRNAAKIGYYQRVIGELFATEHTAGHPLKWLDVGAGYGEVVEAIQSALPATDVEGIEPMRPKVEIAQARGVRVSDRSIAQTDSDYDVISLINVYSHIPDFREFGELLVSKLKSGGILFLETGNLPDLTSRADFPDTLYLPDHLVFAAPRQMESIAKSIGLAMETTKAERIDNPLWAVKQTVKSALRGKPRIVLPYTSEFRTVFYKLRKP